MSDAYLVNGKQWGYFTFGCVAFLWVAWTVTWTARKHAAAIGPDVSKVYLICGVWTIFLWFLYPIAWGLSEGGNVIAPDSEAVFYGILDIMAKPVFGTLLLWGHRNIEPARLGSKYFHPSNRSYSNNHAVNIRDYDEAPLASSTREKPLNGHNTGVIASDGNTATTTGASTV